MKNVTHLSKLFFALTLAFGINVFVSAYDFKAGDLCYSILNYEEVAVVEKIMHQHTTIFQVLWKFPVKLFIRAIHTQ